MYSPFSCSSWLSTCHAKVDCLSALFTAWPPMKEVYAIA